MGYPTKLLSDGETIQFELRPHWRGLIVPAVVLIALAFAGVWLWNTVAAWDNAIGTLARYAIPIAAVIILVVWVITPFLQWISSQYVFTDRRIIVRSGVLAKRGRDMPLSKVNNVTFEVPVLGRILNYGELQIESASDNSSLDIKDVPNVEEIQREVYRLHEEDDERRRRRSMEFGGDPVPPGES